MPQCPDSQTEGTNEKHCCDVRGERLGESIPIKFESNQDLSHHNCQHKNSLCTELSAFPDKQHQKYISHSTTNKIQMDSAHLHNITTFIVEVLTKNFLDIKKILLIIKILKDFS